LGVKIYLAFIVFSKYIYTIYSIELHFSTTIGFRAVEQPNSNNHSPPSPESVSESPVLEAYVIADEMPSPGHHIGQNRIVEILACSAHTVVYKCWNEQLQHMRVIKMLRPGYTDRHRLLYEAQAARAPYQIHPALAQVYSFSLWGRLPYIEMEYIQGMTIQQMLDTHGTLPVAVALSIGARCAYALHFSHGRHATILGINHEGILHCNLTPSNIFVTHTGEVKITDFHGPLFEQPGSGPDQDGFSGRAAYFSPEQLEGKQLNQRADIYSLGAVLYKMIGGRDAFQQGALDESIGAKRNERYEPLRRVNRAVSESVSGCIDLCLRADRGARYSDAAQLGTECDTALKTYSGMQPQRILSSFLEKPSRKRFLSSRFISRKHRRTYIAAAVIAGTTIGIVSLISAAYRTTPLRALFSGGTGNRADYAMPSIPVHNSGAGGSQQNRYLTDANTALRSATRAAAVVSTTLDTGFACYENGDYAGAIAALERVDRTGLPDSLVERIGIRLIDSYVAQQDYVTAESLLTSETIDDGYYYVLGTKIFHVNAKYRFALDYCEKAKQTTSRYSPSWYRRALYWEAKTYELLYASRMTANMKNEALRAWVVYDSLFCGLGKNQDGCFTARASIAALKQKPTSNK
jgi:serine/threonine protein kinase